MKSQKTQSGQYHSINTPDFVIKTQEDLDRVKAGEVQEIPRDQQLESAIGCKYWYVRIPGSPSWGCLCHHPTYDRGAYGNGGDSFWGDWEESEVFGERLFLDSSYETGMRMHVYTDGTVETDGKLQHPWS